MVIDSCVKNKLLSGIIDANGLNPFGVHTALSGLIECHDFIRIELIFGIGLPIAIDGF